MWQGQGIRSPEHWLAWRTGLSPERSRQIVAAARRQNELPETFGAFRDGLLSIDQVAVVVKCAPVHNDRETSRLAQSATVVQLRAALSKAFVSCPVGPDEQTRRMR